MNCFTKRLNNSRIFILSIRNAWQSVWISIAFVSRVAALQTCCWRCWAQWKKKEFETFQRSTRAAEMKGQAPWLKAFGRQLIFLSHPLHPHADGGGHGLSMGCTNIDEAVARIYCAATECLGNFNNFVRPTNLREMKFSRDIYKSENISFNLRVFVKFVKKCSIVFKKNIIALDYISRSINSIFDRWRSFY